MHCITSHWFWSHCVKDLKAVNTSVLANAADGDDTLQILANTEQMMAVFPAIALASNPFQSASSLSNEEIKQKANDFKTSLLLYYFSQRPPGPTPGLLVQQPQHMPTFTIQSMVSLSLC